MKLPLSWLREFVAVEGSPHEVGEILNEIGLIVDAVEVPGRDIAGVVAAEVLEVVAHPDADKLTLVDVDFGSGQTRVVCGAHNLTAGDVVPYAAPGATLPGGITLEKRKIRGQVSDGMLCSEVELGLGDDADGIMHLDPAAERGRDVRDILGLDDAVFDLDITPNRPDAMSVVGVARDVAAATGRPLVVADPELAGGGPPADTRCTVDVVDRDRCPRYLAMTGTVTTGPSPAWLARRLTLAGLRPISSIVDVTNYVLLECGQPLHAFDHARLGGRGIRVRLARDGESITTLDGEARMLTSDDLLICDAEDVPQAIAGVMGGSTSEVGPETTEVLLESAHFEPGGVLRTSKRLGLRTESSARFERGVDPNGVDVAARRAWQLFEEVADGVTGEGAVDEYPQPMGREQITLRADRVNAVLGTDLSVGEIRAHLEALTLDVSASDGRLDVSVPTFRPDLTREADLIEEVARLHGYNQIERTLPHAGEHLGTLTTKQVERRTVLDALVGAGLSEAMTISLVAPSDLEAAGQPGVGIEVENPLRAEESLLRTAVLPGLLRSVAFNASHGNPDTALFEVGKVFHAPLGNDVLPDEREHLAVALSGRFRREPHEDDREIDVFDVKGLWENLIDALALADVVVDPAERPGFHPSRCAAIFVDGGEVGAFGEVAPEVVARLELPEPTVALEIDLGRVLVGARRDRQYRTVSRFPPSGIDLAFVVDESLPAARLEATLREAGGELLEELRLFDRFEGSELGEGRVSLAYRLRFRAPDRTLTDDEVAEMRQACIDAAASAHDAELRG